MIISIIGMVVSCVSVVGSAGYIIYELSKIF